MTIIETMARAIQTADRATDIAGECPQEGAATSMAEDVSDWGAFLSRAALRAIKPSDISDGMVEAYLRAHGGSDESVKKALFMGVNDFRRALAAAIAAGAEQ